MDINQEKDKEFDKALRPLKFSDFFGQESIIKNLKVFEQSEGETIFFRVEMTNIGSEEEGEKLCSILSSRQFSCLLFNELGSN